MVRAYQEAAYLQRPAQQRVQHVLIFTRLNLILLVYIPRTIQTSSPLSSLYIQR